MCHPRDLLTAFQGVEFVVDLQLDLGFPKKFVAVVDKFVDLDLEIEWDYKAVEFHMAAVERQDLGTESLDTLGWREQRMVAEKPVEK